MHKEQTGQIVTDLIDQIVQLPEPSERTGWIFGRVRAVYVADGRLRIVVLLTSGYLRDVQADGIITKKEGWRDEEEKAAPGLHGRQAVERAAQEAVQ